MKKLKLNYLAFSLVALTICSCASEDIIENDTNTAKETTDSFYFDANIDNYEVDGKLVYDRKLIANAAKDAWHVAWDYSLSKVQILTTKREFEKFKNANLDFKVAFERLSSKTVEKEDTTLLNNLMANTQFDNVEMETMKMHNNAKNATTSASSSRVGTGIYAEDPNYDINNYPHENDTDDVVLHVISTAIGLNRPEYFNQDLVYDRYNTNTNVMTNVTDQGGANGSVRVTQRLVNVANLFRLTASQGGTIVNHSKVRKILFVFARPDYSILGPSTSVYIRSGETINARGRFTFNGVAAGSTRIIDMPLQPGQY